MVEGKKAVKDLAQMVNDLPSKLDSIFAPKGVSNSFRRESMSLEPSNDDSKLVSSHYSHAGLSWRVYGARLDFFGVSEAKDQLVVRVSGIELPVSRLQIAATSVLGRDEKGKSYDTIMGKAGYTEQRINPDGTTEFDIYYPLRSPSNLNPEEFFDAARHKLKPLIRVLYDQAQAKKSI